MKFKRVKAFDDRFGELDEVFTTEHSKNRHYNQHVTKEEQYPSIISPDEYEAIADDLAKRRVDHKTIFGYQTEAPDGDDRIRYAKYNKATEDFVVYGLDENNEPLIITLHKKTWREYTIDHNIKYLGEIPEGK